MIIVTPVIGALYSHTCVMLVYYKATLTDILSGSLHNRPYTQAAHTPKQTLEKINIANAHVYFDTASVLGFLTRRSSLLVIGMQ